MKNLGTNEWTILNNIIYKIYTTEHFDEMRLALMEELRMLIDFDSADFFRGYFFCFHTFFLFFFDFFSYAPTKWAFYYAKLLKISEITKF